MTTQPKRRIQDVPNKEFVRAWQAAKSVDHMLELLGLGDEDRTATSSRANKLRDIGVPLRFFRKHREPVDGKALAELQRIAKEAKC